MTVSKKNQNWDAIVLGAGIAGLGVARALALQKKKILVLDMKRSGSASPHASGILDPFVDLDLRPEILALTIPAVKKYPRWVRQIESGTGLKTGYQKYDLLYVAFSKDEEKKLRQFLRVRSVQNQVHLRWMSASEIKEREPGISSRVIGGLCLSGVARVFPAQLIKVLKAWLRMKGVHIRSIQETPQLLIEKERAIGIRLGSRSLRAAQIVGCQGVWAGIEKRSSGFYEPVEPLRGQVVIYRRSNPLTMLLHTVDGGYLIPWSAGSILAGSTVERAGFNAHVNAAGKKKIGMDAARMMPQFAKIRPSRAWAGLRPRHRSGYPRIGKTRISGYYVANGYFRCGILIGFYAGELLAQVMRTGKVPGALRFFSASGESNGKE